MSVISEHRLKENHDFNWANVEILDNEMGYYKRLISEMVHIKRQAFDLNKHTDTDSLPEIYSNIIERLNAL